MTLINTFIALNLLAIVLFLGGARFLKHRTKRLREQNADEQRQFLESSKKNIETLLAEEMWMVANTTDFVQRGEHVCGAIVHAMHLQQLQVYGGIRKLQPHEYKLITALAAVTMTFGAEHQAGLVACCNCLVESVQLNDDGIWTRQFPDDVTAEMEIMRVMNQSTSIFKGLTAEA
jgi:predicted ABC-class ATPase